MSNQRFDKHFTALTPDNVILTPNRRLAVVLHEHYAIFQQKQQKQCWQKPTILSINAWLESLWQHYLISTTDKAPYLLNTTQTQMLWESIISSDQSHNLLQVVETAEALKSAWELIHQYHININDPAFQLTEDYTLCQQWLHQYQTVCQQKNYLDSAALTHFLVEKIATGTIDMPEKIYLYGFTEVVPQYKKLFSSCNVELLSLDDFDLTGTVKSDATLSLPDPDSEIIAMARFAKATRDAHPDASIGCVVLDLNQRRERILQLFTQVFFPDKPFDINPIDYPFNISAGKNLGSYPLIATALAICNLSNSNMTREQFSSILLSPYIGEADSESAERAKFDAELRRNNVHLVQLSSIPNNCPSLSLRLNALQPLIDSKKRNYHEWAQHFNNMLAAVGWPGEKSLLSEEYQVAQAWLTVLADFSSLDHIAKATTKTDAWQRLRQIVNAHIFQPQSPKTNIQVLGLLEAAAVPFDYLWIAGMNDVTWPPQPNPHPFIPKSLQRQLTMPHATAERELSFCTTILKQFQEAATHRIFSHAHSDGKLEFKPSSLLQQLPTTQLTTIAQADYTEPATTVFLNKKSMTFSDATAPSIPPQQTISGGADLIKQQAACPFRAFATHRLNARELETSTQGLNPKDRGIILHDVMQRIWDEIKSQEKLLAIDDIELQSIIMQHIELAIKKNAPLHHHETFYIKLEQQRLAKIVTQWLQLEKSRPPFIASIREEAAKVELLGRELSVRIDRIDTLADGRKLIIDYKSGSNNSIKKWFGDRPDEPQLPLYTLIDPHKTIGISFAQLAAGNLCFKGISSDELNIKGINTEEDSWQEKIAEWRVSLEKLTADFIAGDATVNPKRPSDTCKHCAITPLCRIYETADPSYDDDASEDVYE